MAERFWASTIEAGQSSVRGVAPVDRENGDVLGNGSGIAGAGAMTIDELSDSSSVVAYRWQSLK